jgi:hypothetical protein
LAVVGDGKKNQQKIPRLARADSLARPFCASGAGVENAEAAKTGKIQSSADGDSKIIVRATRRGLSVRRMGLEIITKGHKILTTARGGGVVGGEERGADAWVNTSPKSRSSGAAQRARRRFSTRTKIDNLSRLMLHAHRSVTGRSPGGRSGGRGEGVTLLRGWRGALDVR